MVRGPDGMLQFDLCRRLPGRGAWVCPSPSCMAAALRPRKLAWAFRRETATPSPLEAQAELERLLSRRLLDLVGMAARSGALVTGHDAAARSISSGTAHLLLLARDLSPRTAVDLRRRAASIPVLEAGTMQNLGDATGRSATGVAAITDPGLAQAVIRTHALSAALGLYI